MPPEAEGVLPSNAWFTTSIQQPLIPLCVPSRAGPHPRLVASSLTPICGPTRQSSDKLQNSVTEAAHTLGLSSHSIGPWHPSAYVINLAPAQAQYFAPPFHGPRCISLMEYFPSPATLIFPITTPATLSLTTPTRPANFSSTRSFAHRNHPGPPGSPTRCNHLLSDRSRPSFQPARCLPSFIRRGFKRLGLSGRPILPAIPPIEGKKRLWAYSMQTGMAPPSSNSIQTAGAESCACAPPNHLPLGQSTGVRPLLTAG